MNYSPLEDRILVRPKTAAELEKTDGGIIIPDSAKKEVKEGTVVAAGVGLYARDSGVWMPTVLGKGDVVLFGAGQGLPITVETDNGKEEVLIMREGDVLMLLAKASGEKQ